MPSEMKNPYQSEGELERVLIGRGTGRLLVGLFLAVLVVPPLARNLIDFRRGDETVVQRLVHRERGTGLLEHLREVEEHVEGAFFTKVPRRLVQQFRTRVLQEGNRKTVIGSDGWLYLRPSVEALVATGPVRRAPVGAASDPKLKHWRGPRDAILRFAEDLSARGIELLLVPVPVKAMVRPEGLGLAGEHRAVNHADAAEFYREIEEFGVSVLDLGDRFWELRGGGDVFLKQDTHWTPRAMEAAVRDVAAHIKGRDWWREAVGASRFEVTELNGESVGDLVEQLELGEGQSWFKPERIRMRKVVDSETGARPEPDKLARVGVIGDSFVNVFDDAGLGFAGKGDEAIGAGFAQHLAVQLGEPVYVSALNGQGATGARVAFAKLFDDEVRAKKVVVWVIASRDLLYTPSLAMGNSVEWGDVEWNPETSPATGENRSDAGDIVEAVLVKKAKLTDPNSPEVNYRHSLFETEWDMLRVEGSGEIKEGVRVFFWGFRDKIATRESKIRVGSRYRFEIFAEGAKEGVVGARRDALPDPDFSESYFGERVESR